MFLVCGAALTVWASLLRWVSRRLAFRSVSPRCRHNPPLVRSVLTKLHAMWSPGDYADAADWLIKLGYTVVDVDKVPRGVLVAALSRHCAPLSTGTALAATASRRHIMHVQL